MKGILLRIVVVLTISLIVIQFFHPKHNTEAQPGAQHISQAYSVPAEVTSILTKACFDCHSNNTRYPWYANVQPVDWWLNDHIKEGKEELNFSVFGTYSLLRQSRKLAKAAEEVQEGEMPLSSYTILHKDAVLSKEEKAIFTQWAEQLSKDIYARVTPAEIEADKKRREERAHAKEEDK